MVGKSAPANSPEVVREVAKLPHNTAKTHKKEIAAKPQKKKGGGDFCGFAARKKKNQQPQTVSKSVTRPQLSAKSARCQLPNSPQSPHHQTTPAPNQHPPKSHKNAITAPPSPPKSAATPHRTAKIDLFLRGKAAFFAPFFAASRQLFLFCRRPAYSVMN